MPREYAVEFAAYCYETFGRKKGTRIMASEEAYMVWKHRYIKTAFVPRINLLLNAHIKAAEDAEKD